MARLLKLPHEVITMIDSFARTPCELEFVRKYGTKFNATKLPVSVSRHLWSPGWAIIPAGVTRHVWEVDSSAYSSLIPGTDIAVRCALGLVEFTVVSGRPPYLVLEPRSIMLTGAVELNFSTLDRVFLFVDVPKHARGLIIDGAEDGSTTSDEDDDSVSETDDAAHLGMLEPENRVYG